jgi:hypothetical protein
LDNFFRTIFGSEVVREGRCDPPEPIAEFSRALPDDNRERHAAIGERPKSSPEDFSLNRLFLDGSVYERSAIPDKYMNRFAANPDNVDDQISVRAESRRVQHKRSAAYLCTSYIR